MVVALDKLWVQIVFRLDEVLEHLGEPPTSVALSLPLIVDTGVRSGVHHTYKKELHGYHPVNL